MIVDWLLGTETALLCYGALWIMLFARNVNRRRNSSTTILLMPCSRWAKNADFQLCKGGADNY
jgi:hypothetical protein